MILLFTGIASQLIQATVVPFVYTDYKIR